MNALTEVAVVAAVIAFVQVLGMTALIPIGGTAIFHPHAGIGIGWLLARGPRASIGILIGAACGDALVLWSDNAYVRDNPQLLAMTAFSQGVADVLVALTAYGLARVLLQSPVTLLRTREVVLFIGVVIPTAVLVGTGWDSLTLHAAGLASAGLTWQPAAEEFVSTALGAIACAPVVLVLLGIPREVWRRRKSMMFFTPAAYVGILWGASAVGRSIASEQQAKFREHVVDALAIIELRLSSCANFASAVQAFYASSKEVERGEFESFTRELLTHAPSVRAVEWVPVVKGEIRSAFESAAQAEGLQGFQITERSSNDELVRAAERSEYFPAWYVEPFAGNRPALGFDLGSESTRLSAITQARKSGHAVATSPIRLVQSPNGLGALLLAAVYSNEINECIGLVCVVVDAHGVFGEPSERLERAGISLSVTDESAQDSERVLFSSTPGQPLHAGDEDRQQMSQVVWFGGRSYRVDVATTSAAVASAGPLYFLAQYGSFAVLFAILAAAHLITSGRDLLVEAEVAERSAQLRETAARFQSLVDAAPAALLGVSPSGSIVLVNREALRVFGYSLDQLLGKSPNMLLSTPVTGQSGDLILLRDDDGTKGRLVHCRSAAGTILAMRVRSGKTEVAGSALTVVSLTENTPLPPGQFGGAAT